MKKYTSLFVVFVILTAGVFLRTVNIDKDLSGDELLTIRIAQADSNKIITMLKEMDIYPPLTYLMVHHWSSPGASNAWIRGYFMLFGIGVCLLIYLITKEYLGEEAARLALLLSAFSPLLIFASQYVRSYIDSAFWMLLSVLFMLKILKGRGGLLIWTGYVAAAALSLYTFYFSALLIFAQLIFIVIVTFKNKKMLLKWFFAFSGVGLIFLPCLAMALRQFHNASGAAFDWSAKGLNFGAFRIGLYTRNIFSLIGFDPYFMVFQGGVTKHFSKGVLLSGIFISLCLIIFFLYSCFKFLESRFSANKTLIWVFPFLIFFPLVLSWMAVALFNTLPNAKYLVVFHALFLILLAAFIYSLLEKKRLVGNIVLFFIIVVFSLRIQDAVSPEFDYTRASQFLKTNLTKDDCLICILPCPIRDNYFRIVETGDFFKVNGKRSGYIPVSKSAWEGLRSKIAPHKEIWFYKVYGNAEVFGADAAIDDFLKNEGYAQNVIKRFRNIDIVKYKRP